MGYVMVVRREYRLNHLLKCPDCDCYFFTDIDLSSHIESGNHVKKQKSEIDYYEKREKKGVTLENYT